MATTNTSGGGLILVFDTETTGLVGPNMPLAKYPHMTQLAFLLYDPASRRIVQKFNEYIRLPPGVAIPPRVVELTQITDEMCAARGVPIADALVRFYHAYIASSVVVAHNLEFDRLVVMGEFQRNQTTVSRWTPGWRQLFNASAAAMASQDRSFFCTMRGTRDHCQLYTAVNAKGGRFLKNPTLAELYAKLCGRDQESDPNTTAMATNGLRFHDAMVDCMITLRCYLMFTRRHPEPRPVVDA
jgi:DNA polymerase III epsilon subunit-like protein